MSFRASCKCCNQSTESHLIVTCSVCKDKYKHSCVDITTNEIRILNSNKGYDWTCINCRAIGKDLKDLKALIIKLQKDINDLKNEKDTTENRQIDFEEIVIELEERQKRKKNVIVYNIPEPNSNAALNEQRASDKVNVSAILNTVLPELPCDNLKLFRLGAFSTTKNRPVRVILDNEEAVRKVLKNSSKLKSKNEHKNINISADRTKKQMDLFRKTKEELTERINAGDTNCRIKYIMGIPRIVDLN